MAAIRKPLHKPPYVHNWVRYNHLDYPKMVREMVRFEGNRPQYTYVAGQKIIADRILLQITEETALKAARETGHIKSRPHVSEYVRAHFENEETTKIAGLPAYDELVQPFRISRDVSVPVKPLAVVSKNGILQPVFVVGWASMPLDDFQRRLLMTVLEDAVFTLEDFRKCPGIFLSYPKVEPENGGEPARKLEMWRRGDFNLLTEKELTDHLQAYLSALDEARTIIASTKVQVPQPDEGDNITIDNGQLSLFE